MRMKMVRRKSKPTNFQSVTGKGAYAEIDGVTTYIGSIELGAGTFFIARSNVAKSDNTSTSKENLSWRLSQVQNYSGLIAVADPIRAESQDSS